MTDIRYVCISDMHLGEEDSLLTNLKPARNDADNSKAGPVLIKFVDCLRELISHNNGDTKPTLILNGDILELALTDDNEALMAFERFIEQIFPKDAEALFEKVIYVPGNHDHHLWELARETQYIKYIQTIAPGDRFLESWHTTHMQSATDANLIESTLLTALVQRHAHLKNLTIHMAYPNYALYDEASRRCVVFHHGHYMESLYHLMTELSCLIFPKHQRPQNIWDIEAENFAWIDFFWSTMGRSGDVGHEVEAIYEKLQDEKQFKKLLHSLADSLARKYDLPGPGDWAEAKLLKWLMDAVVDYLTKRERKQKGRTLSEEGKEGLSSFITGPLKNQLLSELDEVPGEVTFVFGHTHKPYEAVYDDLPSWLNWVINTGGWVVETVHPSPTHGASVVLVDEQLNCASLRMYNETANPSGDAVSLCKMERPGVPVNPLVERLSGQIHPEQSPWLDFSKAAAEAVVIRARAMKKRVTQ
ncbi:MAG: metallophosphoesterase [Deltaproteobacteria bacterium]|nr:metallophosphoesterase [Deltaproteobacteria bacterium]